MRLGVALGSNLGDRLAQLRQAVAALQRELHELPHPFLVSGVYETEPLDCPPDSPLFLNAAVELETSLSPRQVLSWCQAYERAHGRPADHGYHTPRTVDVDLLYLGEVRVAEPDLILPHPRLGERLFVLAPLAEIAPERIFPDCPHGVAAQLAERKKSDAAMVLRRCPEVLWP